MKAIRCRISSRLSQLRRGYHTYPSPDDKGVVTTAISTGERCSEKNPTIVSSEFDMCKPFPEISLNKIYGASKFYEVNNCKLSNGLGVATCNLPTLMSSFAVMIGTGSSYENQVPFDDYTGGAAHMLELQAFRGTKSMSFTEVSKEIERLGGMVQCISSREYIMYCVDVLRDNISPAMDILRDTILEPSFCDEDLEEGFEIMKFQRTALTDDIFSKENTQRAGFSGSPLGNFHYCPEDRMQLIDRPLLENFRKKFFTTNNSYICGSGVDHDSFVRLVEDKFANYSRGIVSSDPLKFKNQRPKSVYKGGLIMETRPLQLDYTRVGIAFPCGGWHSNDVVVACVLQQLLGGGSSFSAGGPGKGMYTRLYSRVLNGYEWVESAESFVNIHDEHGILGVDGSCSTEAVPAFLSVIISEIASIAYFSVTDEEFSRAKNMLRSMMMMQLESRLVLCEDLCRQFVVYGKREDPHSLAAKIMAVTKEELMMFARKLINQSPAVSVTGPDVDSLQLSYGKILEYQTYINHKCEKHIKF